MINNITFSILIPAYNFDKGVSRILNFLDYNEEVEILIYDNSTNEIISSVIENFKKKFKNNLIYLHYECKSPIENWNNLIKKARGKFYTLLHHDELFLLNIDYKNFINYLKNTNKCIIISKCFIIKKGIKLHFPLFLTNFIIYYFPSYIFKRNFIGPTACLVINKNVIDEYYDDNLKWLVDVDFYFRIFKYYYSKIQFSNYFYIYSYQDNSISITSNIKHNLSNIVKKEYSFLTIKYPNLKFKKFSITDLISWYSIKLILYPFLFQKDNFK